MTTSYKPTFSRTASAISTGTIVSAAMLFAQPAQASIITIQSGQTTLSERWLSFDVNGDSSTDLVFRHIWRSYSNGQSETHDLYAEGANGAKVKAGLWLNAGSLIDASLSYTNSNHLVDYDYTSSGSCDKFRCYGGSGGAEHNGTWAAYGGATVHGYLGFQLSSGTDQYFGWADMHVPFNGNATVVSVAYETCANVGIVAGQTTSACGSTDNGDPSEVPEPAPLALLAIGAAGVAVMRRRRSRPA